jgi:hypothetical protein
MNEKGMMELTIFLNKVFKFLNKYILVIALSNSKKKRDKANKEV